MQITDKIVNICKCPLILKKWLELGTRDRPFTLFEQKMQRLILEKVFQFHLFFKQSFERSFLVFLNS